MPKQLIVTPERCTGCRTCELACAFAHGESFHLAKPRVAHVHFPDDRHITMLCLQCEDPACARVCPVEAIVRNEATGAMEILEERCIRCGTCLAACPFGNISVDPRFCDLEGGDYHLGKVSQLRITLNQVGTVCGVRGALDEECTPQDEERFALDEPVALEFPAEFRKVICRADVMEGNPFSRFWQSGFSKKGRLAVDRETIRCEYKKHSTRNKRTGPTEKTKTGNDNTGTEHTDCNHEARFLIVKSKKKRYKCTSPCTGSWKGDGNKGQ